MTHNDIWTNKFMITAMEQAYLAANVGEVPVGAVVVKGDRIISSAHNLCERNNNPLLHAEILAIERAMNVLGDMRLDGCDMYVTLEPCPMCAGAIINSRIKTVYYGASDNKAGSFGSVVNFNDLPYNHKPQIVGGVMADETQAMLTTFFKELRSKKK